MGELMRAYKAGQDLLCRPPSNSNALGIPAARLVPACTPLCLRVRRRAATLPHPLRDRVAGLLVPCRQFQGVFPGRTTPRT